MSFEADLRKSGVRSSFNGSPNYGHLVTYSAKSERSQVGVEPTTFRFRDSWGSLAIMLLQDQLAMNRSYHTGTDILELRLSCKCVLSASGDCCTRAKRTRFFSEFFQAIEIIMKTLTRPSLSGIGTHLYPYDKENQQPLPTVKFSSSVPKLSFTTRRGNSNSE